ncbi:hypothetical protein LB577_08310 [Mesorhizobium sp. B283B1A]|uniref:hypothetical protein n=1 Tax=Mesorhizobium TaxID=68287 RepID=UPI001CD0DD50|nr:MULTISPECIES: hypothetical protein [Mesorhizobium]MCA0046958.1 hypothetical protein [Mesorhizobium sp. B283B1A]UQS66633.1 hypothetical protein M5D98_10000 [Mesorhizobium opportunistum]
MIGLATLLLGLGGVFGHHVQESDFASLKRSRFAIEGLVAASEDFSDAGRIASVATCWEAIVNTIGHYRSNTMFVVFGYPVQDIIPAYGESPLFRAGNGREQCFSKHVRDHMSGHAFHFVSPLDCLLSGNEKFDVRIGSDGRRPPMIGNRHRQFDAAIMGGENQRADDIEIDPQPGPIIQDHGSFGDFGGSTSGLGSVFRNLDGSLHVDGLLSGVFLNQFHLLIAGQPELVGGAPKQTGEYTKNKGEEGHGPVRRVFNEAFAPIFFAAALLVMAGLFVADNLARRGRDNWGLAVFLSSLLVFSSSWLWVPALLIWLGVL